MERAMELARVRVPQTSDDVADRERRICELLLGELAPHGGEQCTERGAAGAELALQRARARAEPARDRGHANADAKARADDAPGRIDEVLGLGRQVDRSLLREQR